MFKALSRASTLMLVLGLAACSSAPSWHKTGAEAGQTQDDSTRCHIAAVREAERLYPYGFSPPSHGAYAATAGLQRDDIDRAAAEARSYEACMRNRGYSRESPPGQR